jgi:hypothetical protein
VPPVPRRLPGSRPGLGISFISEFIRQRKILSWEVDLRALFLFTRCHTSARIRTPQIVGGVTSFGTTDTCKCHNGACRVDQPDDVERLATFGLEAGDS